MYTMLSLALWQHCKEVHALFAVYCGLVCQTLLFHAEATQLPGPSNMALRLPNMPYFQALECNSFETTAPQDLLAWKVG